MRFDKLHSFYVKKFDRQITLYLSKITILFSKEIGINECIFKLLMLY